MKKLFIISVLSILLFEGCKKRFPDGPLISFRSLDTRISGIWELENYIVDGIDSTEIINNVLGSKCEICFYTEGQKKVLTPYTIQWGNDTSNYFYSGYETGEYHKEYDDGNIFIILKYFKGNNSLPNWSQPNIYLVFGDTSLAARRYQILKCRKENLWLKTISHNKTYELHMNRKS